MTEQQFDLRPFQLYVPVPPMLAEAIGYTGQVLGHPLDARYVGFYWQRSGDEAAFDDGKSSGTGEWTGYLAFVNHSKVAVHLQHCDFGSSETLPRHMLVLDRTEQRLYALPVRVAQQFLLFQWNRPDQGAGGSTQIPTLEYLQDVLNLDTWTEVSLPQDQLVKALVEWLNEQHVTLTPERTAEFKPGMAALLLRHVMAGKTDFAPAGDLVHVHAVHEVLSGAMISFFRDNGSGGPDTSLVFTVNGSWTDIAETLEALLDLGSLDDLLAGQAPLQQVFGRYADWYGQPSPVVPLLGTPAMRVSLPCSRCGRNPMTAFARSGLHRGLSLLCTTCWVSPW